MSLDAPDPVPTVDVAAALIEQDGRYLIARRRDDAVLGGFWEFPGGKRRTGESLQACLVREVREELGVEVTVGELWERVVHAYPHATVALYVFQGILVGGVPRAIGCAEIRWVVASELGDHRFPPANGPIIRRLMQQPIA
jgi:mutator protein MutT